VIGSPHSNFGTQQAERADPITLTLDAGASQPLPLSRERLAVGAGAGILTVE
jgi:hypothetical protein